MSPFDFLSVIFSVVIGLGISHLLTGVAQLVRHRDSVVSDWVSILWVATVFLFLVAAWWGLWPLREAREWSYSSFLLLVAYQSGLYFMATLVLPDVTEPNDIDLAKGFEKVRSPFFVSLSIVSLSAFLVNASLFKIPILSQFALLPLSGTVLALAGARISRVGFQKFLALFFFVGTVAMVVFDQTVLR